MTLKKKSRRRLVSVIIPTYKQEKTIIKDIKKIEKALEQIPYNYEIIVTVDGKKDGRTWEKLTKIKSSKIKITGYDHNHGKGHAVRYGMAQAKGDLIAFLDAG